MTFKSYKPDDEIEIPSVVGHYLSQSDRLATIEAVVLEQAEDEGLWFEATTAPEAYLQEALKRLHRVIEGKESPA